MDKAFHLAFAPSAHFCFGVRLEPLTIGHVFTILEIKPDFLESEGWTLGQLATAALICSQDWRTSKRDLTRWWIAPLLYLWAFRCRKMTITAEVIKFSEYLDSSFSAPQIKRNLSEASQNKSSPWLIRLVAILCSEFSISFTEAMDMRLTLAQCLWAAKCDATGDIEFWSDDDERFWQDCHRKDLEALKEARN